jgi:fructoselysine-6-P-deglycase FrlB-like protein
MRRELDEQPGILADIAPELAAIGAALRPEPARPLWVGGCGDSLFAAQALTRHFRQLGYDIRPASAAELLWDAPVAAGDTVVGISISGSTRRTVEAIAAATHRGARTIAVTLNPDSDLALAATDVLPLPYTPISRAIPHGLDYHVTLLALAALAGDIDGVALSAILHSATPGALSRAIDAADALPPEARFLFLGGGAGLGTAQYGAAKLHEAGGLPAWAHEAENFAHGAQFMLRPGDHAVLCRSGGRADARTAMMRAGLERLGITISDAGDGNADPLAAAVTAALDCQALCLAVAEARDLDVTDPARGSLASEVQRDWFGWTTAG